MSTTTSAAGALERTADSPDAIAPKGLRSGVIGLLGSTVLGVVQTAPAYSIANEFMLFGKKFVGQIIIRCLESVGSHES